MLYLAGSACLQNPLAGLWPRAYLWIWAGGSGPWAPDQLGTGARGDQSSDWLAHLLGVGNDLVLFCYIINISWVPGCGGPEVTKPAYCGTRVQGPEGDQTLMLEWHGWEGGMGWEIGWVVKWEDGIP